MNGIHLDCNGYDVSIGDYVRLMRPGRTDIVVGKVSMVSRLPTTYIRVAYYCEEKRELYSDIVYAHRVQLIKGVDLTEVILKYGDIL